MQDTARARGVVAKEKLSEPELCVIVNGALPELPSGHKSFPRDTTPRLFPASPPRTTGQRPASPGGSLPSVSHSAV